MWALFLFVLLASLCWKSFYLTRNQAPLKSVSSNYETIGQGPFSLNPQYLNPHTPKVLESFFVVQGSKRVFGKGYLYLGSHDSKTLQKLSYEEFLKLDIFKDDQGRDVVWQIKPLKEDKAFVIFEAKQGLADSMMISLPIVSAQQFQSEEYQNFLNSQPIAVLSKTKIGGSDCLFENDSLKKAVLILDSKKVISLAVDELLYYVGGSWQKEKAEEVFIAELKHDGADFYFNVIDPSGFFQHSLKLIKASQESFSMATMVPENVKVYDTLMISCTIAHQRLILKKGDWVVKAHHVCQVLKSKTSLEKFLNFERYGPLCVIEDIEINKERSLVRGKIFSPLRIKVHPFEIEAPVVKISKNIPKTRSKGVKKEPL